MGSAACQNVCPNHQGQQIRNKYVLKCQSKESENSEKENQLTNGVDNKNRLTPILFDDPDQQAFKHQVKSQIKGSAFFNIPPIQIENKTELQLGSHTKQMFGQISPINRSKQSENNQKLVIVSQYRGQQKNESRVRNQQEYEHIIVPFKVIRLTLSKIMTNKILEWDDKFFERMQSTKAFQQNWRLLPHGCYGNIIKKNFGVFINQQQFYQGYFKQDKQHRSLYYPHGNGIFITQNSTYQGNFNLGDADGEGKYIIGDAIYKGDWKNGNLQLGIIQTPDYTYIGNMLQRVPHGNGKLVLKEKLTSYQGKFNKGRFQDEKGVYECRQYIYTGGFRDGMKNGTGTLIQKQKTGVKGTLARDLKKYRPPLKLENRLWIDDQCQDLQ